MNSSTIKARVALWKSRVLRWMNARPRLKRAGAIAAQTTLLVTGFAMPSMAQDLNNIAQSILNELNSTFLQMVAGIVIVGVALMWMFGMMRMGTAAIIFAGVGVAASATTIAGKMFGS
ncbi:TrbC/VIRB2 family protein [Enhydrobacter aerosaccus]|uniref:TrbC/VIRB2 family protein n=1 Tax=Enhydrobacter aerosaccus TaxID=225324 RepID=A0A1T4TIV9_9HYPH|nr:TrbC/VirB2 family protein [Enhydrobacter aerosaccus]SKA40383.1 TrbC/VIRB2 family protein [Enhydrobacter aerosaccus]